MMIIRLLLIDISCICSLQLEAQGHKKLVALILYLYSIWRIDYALSGD